jgi:T5SS/PEP-CTERM-associated repeat protein
MASFYARHCRHLAAACRFLGWIGLLCACAQADAANKRWNNMFGGAFNAAANWTGGIPGSGDVAEFGVATMFTPGTYMVTFDVSPTNQGLKVEDDFVTFDLNGRIYNTTLDSEIGNLAGSEGRLTITDGTWNFATNPVRLIEIGATAGATGTLIVSTGGRITGLVPHVLVGSDGTGTLTVENGGDVFAMTTRIGWTSTGNATITGAGSTLINNLDLVVGGSGNGMMTISAGGQVQSAGGGTASGAVTGTVNVTGFNSRWINSGELVIGSVGSGELTITAGGRVDDTNGYVGFHPGSTGTVTVGELIPGFATSQWINSGTLTVGNSGDGTLNIIPNGRVQNSNAIIAAEVDSFGEVNVSTGAAQWLNLGNLTVAQAGDGTLNLTDGGYAQNVDGTVGADAGSVGTVNVTDPESQWRSTGTATVGLDGNGTLAISDGGIVQVDGTLFIAQNLNSVGVVTVDGTNSDLNSSSGMQIGNSGQATVTVTNGGELSSTFAEIGGLVGITSSVTIDGPNSRWHTTGLIEAGDSGDAAITISNGGTAESSDGVLADAADATASATITGAGSTWTIDGGDLYVGEDGTGTLNVLAGGAVSDVNGHIALDLGSIGAALVSGAGSTWTNTGDLAVGDEGQGELTIAGGGSVANNVGYIGRNSANGGTGSGAVTVTGAGSTWTNTNFVYVGYGSGGGGEGTLNVEAGGTVTCTTGFVGNVAGSHGTATVDGPGSTWTTSGTLAVGDGTLTISNGGAVVTNGLFGTLAAENTWNADVNVTGPGSSWSLTGALLTVAFGGTATVNILDGGNVASFDARLAADTGSTGDVLVSGAGSTWTIGRRLGVGGDAGSLVSGGTGTLSIQPGGAVNVAQNIVIFVGGTLRLEGGTLDAGSVSFNGGGTVEWTSGTLHVGTFGGDLVNQAGTLAPGHSAGSTTITGVYAQQAGGKLEIEIGGTAAGSNYDVVTVNSIAGISGQLQLALLNGFFPSAGNTFTVLTAASGLFGAFANVANGQRLATSDGLGSFLVNYGPGSAFNPNHIVLSAFQTAALPGDFNLDGKVDAADYVKWRKGLGTNYTPAHFNIWRANFGAMAGGGAADQSAPEPTLLPLTIIAGGGVQLIANRPRRRNA